MFKGQAAEGSEIQCKFICTIRAFGGFTIDGLSHKLDSVKGCIYGYYDACVVLMGTNDLVRENFDIWSFMNNFKQILLKFHSRLGCKHVIVLGFLPRAFCKRNCKTNDCLYIHRGRGKISASEFNARIWKTNKGIRELITYDDRFRSFKFVNFCDRIVKLGDADNSFGKFLSVDGLHMSKFGNSLFDKWLIKFLNDMEW